MARVHEDDAVFGESSITSVGGSSGTLAYRGFAISELLPHARYESLVYLLLRGEPPAGDPPADLTRALADLRSVPESLANVLAAIDRSTPAIDALRTALSALGSGRFGSPPTEAEGLELIARSPSILANLARRERGLPPIGPREDLGHVANYLWMLTGTESEAMRVRALEQYFLLLADHGMNASTLALRVVISTGADLGAAATAAISALKGPAHGGATAHVSEMLDEAAHASELGGWARERLDRHERFPGFGHRVYAAEDPRARALHTIASRVATAERFHLAEAVERTTLESLR
ncbi:MAG: citrate/2-methylcitrate synthase, partial [Thermoplasmata archaeon]|nr:citrate/2-methylcitrate synthase [Thermoplasmata archaeon]